MTTPYGIGAALTTQDESGIPSAQGMSLGSWCPNGRDHTYAERTTRSLCKLSLDNMPVPATGRCQLTGGHLSTSVSFRSQRTEAMVHSFREPCLVVRDGRLVGLIQMPYPAGQIEPVFHQRYRQGFTLSRCVSRDLDLVYLGSIFGILEFSHR